MTNLRKTLLLLLSLLISLGTSAFTTPQQDSQPAVVRAVMFWMDGCAHCHEVIENVLPPIQEKYGEQFQIQLIELKGSQEVTALYTLANSMGIPQNDVGVPFLMIGEHVLIGSGQIPAELPGLIDQYLAAGGVDFPDSPALAPLLPKQPDADAGQETASSTTTPSASQVQSPSIAATQPGNPAATPEPQAFQGNNGFLVAWLTIILLLSALAFSLNYLIQSKAWLTKTTYPSRPGPADWLIPVLALVGLGVAAYLAYVETQSVRAFCGPIGDCNTVQSSPYARLFGRLPIGVLGVIGYALIMAAWWLSRSAKMPWNGWATLALLGMTIGGTLFSIYLTYLEVAVIQAVCMWCLSSAWIMGCVLLLSLNIKYPFTQANPKP